MIKYAKTAHINPYTPFFLPKSLHILPKKTTFAKKQ